MGVLEMFLITGLCHLHPALLRTFFTLMVTLALTQWCPACAPSKQSPPSCSRTVSTPCSLYQMLPGGPYGPWSGVCAEWRSLITSSLVLSIPVPLIAPTSSPPLELSSLKIPSTACQIAQQQSLQTPTPSPLQTIHKDIQPMFTFTIS